MFEQIPSPRRPLLRNTVKIARVQLFLSRHLEEMPSLAEIAAMAAMSRSHFSRTFHAITGVTVRDYVRDLRMQRAAALVRSSTVSLTAIAVDCGFYDLPHFDKAFRREYGMSPREFRRQDASRQRTDSC